MYDIKGKSHQVDDIRKTLVDFLSKEKWRLIEIYSMRGGINCPEHGEIEVNLVQGGIYHKNEDVLSIRRKGWCCDKFPMPYSIELRMFSKTNLIGFRKLSKLVENAKIELFPLGIIRS